MPTPKPTPTKIAEAKGAFIKNPQRRNKQEPEASKDAPNMPEIFADIPLARLKWNQLSKWLGDMGILSATDTDLMEKYCLNYARMMQAWEGSKDELVLMGKVGPIRNPLSIEYHKCADKHLKMMTEMGLTPSSRAGLKAGDIKEADPFESYLKAFPGVTERN